MCFSKDVFHRHNDCIAWLPQCADEDTEVQTVSTVCSVTMLMAEPRLEPKCLE